MWNCFATSTNTEVCERDDQLPWIKKLPFVITNIGNQLCTNKHLGNDTGTGPHLYLDSRRTLVRTHHKDWEILSKMHDPMMCWSKVLGRCLWNTVLCGSCVWGRSSRFESRLLERDVTDTGMSHSLEDVVLKEVLRFVLCRVIPLMLSCCPLHNNIHVNISLNIKI